MDGECVAVTKRAVVMTVPQILRKAGGRPALAKSLGYPVTSFLVRLWERCGEIPPAYRNDVARIIGVPVAKITPPPKPEPVRHRGIAFVYLSLYRALGMTRRSASKLHGVPEATIRRWCEGIEEAPAWAFQQYHDLASGRRRTADRLTVEEACRRLRVSQGALARRLGLTASRVSQMKRDGQVPENYAMQIAGWIKEASV
jgi:hypothetical protein